MKKITTLLLFVLFLGSITAQERKVLIEQFSNASCSICATYSPQVYNYADQNMDKVVVITYHTNFPYTHDSMHYENPTAANARVSYYGVNGTPTSVMDGNFFQGSTSSLVGSINTKVMDRKVKLAQYEIWFSGIKYENGGVKGVVSFKSVGDNSAANLKGRLVLIEKSVPKTAYKASPGSNSESVYKNVMRETMEIQLMHKTDGGTDSSVFSIPTSTVKNPAEMYLVVFVQNETTKEVYQAHSESVFATNPGSVGEFDNNIPVWGYDMANKQYLLTLNDNLQNGSVIITDITGKEIISQTFEGNNTAVNVQGLKTGIYLSTVSTGAGQYTTKLWIE